MSASGNPTKPTVSVTAPKYPAKAVVAEEKKPPKA